ncbi:MAG: ATP-binding cassette domain-containing protein [Terrimicrobiaceae bacterium]|nr:ATP-binding cassette domain-containing protein [Terrimicrobiaceae bacterium]
MLDGVSFEVARRTVFSVVGPSGAGKSVLLKCVGGVLTPDEGEVLFDGRPLGETATLASFRRRCSFLFQNNALLDSLTALENVALPIEQTTSLPEDEIRRRALEALRAFELEDFASRHPGHLSGGMQKRLALARAIVTNPEFVFFDEPTAGLDPLRRNAVFLMIAEYQRKFGFTAIVVTHDVAEALVVSDEVAVLDSGRIRWRGKPREFLEHGDAFMRDFRDSAAALRRSIEALESHQPSLSNA